MAKTYAAELLLKNKGLIESLNQAVKKTKELKTELNNISKTTVKVEAKLGSSFKNVEANINRITPKSKTIKIEATENVTKKMNNISRNMFEMSNNMNSTINSSMKGLSTRLSASLPKLQVMSNTMAAIANTSRLMKATSGASALAGAGAGLAGAAALRRNTTVNNTPVSTNTNNLSILDRLKNMGSSIMNVAKRLGTGFTSGFADAMASGSRRIGSAIQRWGNISIDSDGIFADIDGKLGKMIEHQKTKLEELGKLNPLKNWKTAPGDIGFFREWQSSTAKMAAWSASAFKEMAQDAKQALGTAAEWVRQKWNNSVFSQMIQRGKTAFNDLKKTAISKIEAISNKAKQLAYSFKYACDRGVYFFTYFATKAIKPIVTVANAIKSKISSAFNSVKNAANRVASAIPQPIKNTFSKVTNFAKNAAFKFMSAFKSAAGAAGSAIVSGLNSAFNKVKSIASGVAKAIAAAFTAAVAVGVKDMATQEQYITSMTHFISVDDAKTNGNNTITMDQAKERATGLFDWGTEFANSTPFGNAEVYSAINRMTQIFGYGTDGSQIQKMVKLVGDMAALNPGKTMSDAAEAIADLAVGETERMKEFGFKISQDELKTLAGVPGQSDSLTNEQLLTAFGKMTSSGGALFETFDGGADALAGTLAGRWSTFIGQFRQMMVDTVTQFQDILKNTLEKAIDFINGDFATKFTGAFSTIASFIGDLMAGDSSNFPIIENLLNAGETLREAVSPVFDTIIEQYGKLFDSASESFGGMGGIIEGTAKFIADIISGLAPILELVAPIFNTLKETAIAVWPVIQGVIDVAAQIIKDVVEKLQPIFSAVDQIIQVIGQTVADIWPSIQETILNVWNNLQPALDLFGSLCQLIADIFVVAWPPIAGVVEELWNIIAPIFEGIADILGKICGWLDKAVEGFSNLMNKVKDSKWNPFNWVGGEDDSSQNAYGKDRVPYDGYKASLHEGERILTSRQATQMDAGLLGTGGNITNTISISVNGSGDPDATARLVVQRLKETLENTSVKSFI